MKNHVLSLSYGKDSLACLEAIKQLEWPLDRIVHSEVWATDTIPADFPEMVEFKAKADKIIRERYGIEVEHICATKKDGSKWTYDGVFHRVLGEKSYRAGEITGFPFQIAPWCNSEIKMPPLDKVNNDHNNIVYVGIAADEPERLARLTYTNKKSPLAALGWTEADARRWCEENDLLSPIYTHAARGGCWFCHNQSVDQLRILRKKYPELWALLLKWDTESPVSFKPGCKTVHLFDERFRLEEQGKVPTDGKFRWKMLERKEGT